MAASQAASPLRLDSAEAAHAWLQQRRVRALTGDSRRVAPGDAFIAWPGYVTDARRHVGDALAAGAVACLVEADGVDGFGFEGEPRVASLQGLKAAAGQIASHFYGRPSERIDVVAITGTNGKTSTAWWVAQALGSVGKRAAVVGTLGSGEPGGRSGDPVQALTATGLTTPEPITLQRVFADFAASGFAVCAVEASSIGLAEHRLAGTRVAVAAFTNFTQDHLDYHGDMATYWRAKAQLFAWPGLRAAVVNIDDAQGEALAVSLAGLPAGTGIDTWTVSLRSAARLRANRVRYEAQGLAFDVSEGGATAAVVTHLIGDYNVSNLLVVIGVLRALGVSLHEAAAACSAVTSVPGRMQRIVVEADPGRAVGLDASRATTPAAGDAATPDGGDAAAPAVVVDYAHTPDALEKALQALRPLAAQRGGRLWCVFGCGGDRDAAKRPMMGALAARLADRVVVTSDNPRHEPPDFILSQVLAGAVGHDEIDVIENRAEAIVHAVGSAAATDVVLLAGKGHEAFQDIGGRKLPFDDAERAAAALRARSHVASVATGSASTALANRDGKGMTATVGSRSGASGDAVMLSIGEAAGLLDGARLVGDAALAFDRVHSDTRTLRTGDLFVALRGERFDANDFLAEAKAAGAVAALAERGLDEAGLAGIEVADARVALGDLAAAWRRRFELPLAAVTGSNGKTTVTQMIASIFRAWRGEGAFATEGNFNNDIGVPLTLLRLRAGHCAGVVELGMNHVGEIARLATIAAPAVVLVNNAQREHLEFMSSVDAVARENGAAIEALGDDGIAVFPADDEHAATWLAQAGARRVLTFADGAAVASAGDPADAGDRPAGMATQARATGADVTGEADWFDDHWQVALQSPAGAIAFSLHAAGRHNVRNALAAAATALAAGCPAGAIADGLAAFRPVRGRSQMRRVVVAGSERTLVDDSYNANPDSVRAAIDVLAGLPAPRWLVLGDMGEVGSEGPAFHREVGGYAAARGIDSLWAAGAESANTAAPFDGARAFATTEALIAALGEAPPFASVLVKGSRFMRMERVVAALDASAKLAKGDHAL